MMKLIDIDWEKMTPQEIDSVLAERIAFYEGSINKNGGKSPKREGYVIERIATMENLREADKESQDGKVKTNRHIRRHNKHAESDLRALQLMILTLKFPPPNYTTSNVRSDAGKWRNITKQKYYPWRILHHAIMLVVGKVLNRHLIYDTFACIKGKGLHFGVKRMKMMLRRYPEYRYFVKTDYKKFYQSIPHSLIIEGLRKRFKDEHLFKLIDIALFSYSAEDIVESLLKEENDKKRCTHWLIYKPAVGQLCDKLH